MNTRLKPSWNEFHLPLLITVVISLAVYLNALFNGFAFDDTDQVLGNPWILSARSLPTIFSSSVWGFEPGAGSNYYRPMMHVIYMLTNFLFGLRPWGFHLISILFHCGSSVLVFLTARALFDEKNAPLKPLSAPLMAGVLFAVHPVHTEAVAWAAGIPDLSYAFFCLLSLYLYIKSKGGFSAGYYLSVAAFLVGTLCKEPALLLPALLLGYDLLVNKKGMRDLPFLLRRYAPFLLAALAYLGLRFFALRGSMAPQKSGHGGYGFYDLLIIIGNYISKTIIPVNLKFLHWFSPAESLFEAPVAVAVLAIMLISALYYVTFRTDRAAFFCLLVWVAPLLPSFYLPAISGQSLMGERYLYLPSAGFAILVSLAVARIEKTKGLALASVSLFLALTALFSAGTLYRNTDWKDDYSFWAEEVRKSPGSAEAHDNLGLVYARRGQDDLAEDEFLTSLKGFPIAENAFKHLGVLYGKQGRVDESIAALQQALEVKPNDPDTHNELGIQYGRKGEMSRAAEQFKAAAELNIAKTMYRRNLEKTLREMDRPR